MKPFSKLKLRVTYVVNISERLEAPSRRGQGIGEAEISTRERDAVDALKGI